VRQGVAMFVDTRLTIQRFKSSANFTTLDEVHLRNVLPLTVNDTFLRIEIVSFADKTRLEALCHLHKDISAVVEVRSEELAEFRKDVIVEVSDQNCFLGTLRQSIEEVFI
jgi:hypothetical protein